MAPAILPRAASAPARIGTPQPPPGCRGGLPVTAGRGAALVLIMGGGTDWGAPAVGVSGTANTSAVLQRPFTGSLPEC